MGCCRSEFGMMELGSEVVFLLYHFPENVHTVCRRTAEAFKEAVDLM